jgi:hypothetical protein
VCKCDSAELAHGRTQGGHIAGYVQEALAWRRRLRFTPETGLPHECRLGRRTGERGAGSAREREYWKSAGTCLRSFQRPADACFGGASGQRAPRPGLHCSPCPGSPVGTRCMEASGAHGPRGARPPSMLGISQGIVPRLRPRPDAAAQLHACSGAAGPHCVCACPCVLSVVEGPNRAEYERRRCVLCRMFGSQFVQKTTMLWGDDKKKVVKKGNEWVSCASWGAH